MDVYVGVQSKARAKNGRGRIDFGTGRRNLHHCVWHNICAGRLRPAAASGVTPKDKPVSDRNIDITNIVPETRIYLQVARPTPVAAFGADRLQNRGPSYVCNAPIINFIAVIQ